MTDADLQAALDDYSQCDHYACHGWVPILVAEVRRLQIALAEATRWVTPPADTPPPADG